jgi:Zn-finger nucleic acid-binding protein
MADAYRESPRPCPRCGTAITQVRGRTKWRCPGCVGTLVEEAELASLHGWTGFVVRAATEPALKCPICAEAMAPVGVADIALDYCGRDRVIWCDSGELGRIRATMVTPTQVIDARQGRVGIFRDLVFGVLDHAERDAT